MPTIKESVLITRSPEEVFDFLDTASNLPVWDSSIIEAKKVEAESGLGGIFGKLSDPIVENAQRRTVRSNLGTLAELLAQETL